MAVLVGTSGWSYPGGRGTWNGLFYPKPRPRGFDELAYYAEHFDTVEVNSTFYRAPDPVTTREWLRRTPPAFVFSVKLFQKFTHPDMYLAAHGTSDWDVTRGDLDVFRAGLDPLADAGRLAALLIQFPPSFHNGPDTGAYLDWLASALAMYPLAVELRHRSWSDDAGGTHARLAAHGATWALIDEPKFTSSVRQPIPGRTASLVPLIAASPPAAGPGPALAYIRLHGRNAAQWWDHDEAEDRYDYLYSPPELAPFAEAAQESAQAGRRVVMYLNNHFSAKAVANAAVLRHQLGDLVPGDYPRAMIDRYPDLAGIVTTSGLPL
jgi:uncharacterized protein YecE (DUF72 family)